VSIFFGFQSSIFCARKGTAINSTNTNAKKQLVDIKKGIKNKKPFPKERLCISIIEILFFR
jgi:hypothetical protein